MLTTGAKRKQEDVFTKAMLALRANKRTHVRDLALSRRQDTDIYEPCAMSTVFAERLEQRNEVDDCKQSAGRVNGCREVTELKDTIINNTAGTQRHRELINIMIANRLAGISFFSIDNAKENDTSLGIRFDSSYNGTYFETYYFVLQYNTIERVFGHHKKVNVLINLLESEVSY